MFEYPLIAKYVEKMKGDRKEITLYINNRRDGSVTISPEAPTLPIYRCLLASWITEHVMKRRIRARYLAEVEAHRIIVDHLIQAEFSFHEDVSGRGKSLPTYNLYYIVRQRNGNSRH